MRLLILFILSFGIQLCFAQYEPIAIENAQWRIHQDENSTPWEDYKWGYIVKGDTVINSLSYKKVYIRHFKFEEEPFPGHYPIPYQVTSENLYAFIRDDMITGKVHAIYPNELPSGEYCPENEAFLLYDFGVELGDTLDWCICQGACDIPNVVSIETQFRYEKERIIINSAIIEGVGSEHGLFEVPSANLSGFSIGLEDYCIGTNEECGYELLTSTTEILSDKLKIYPNPTSSILNVESGKMIQNIEVFDLFGELVFKSHSNSFNTKMDLSSFKKGIYILKVEIDKGFIISKKVILN